MSRKDLTIISGAVVASECDIRGDITVGTRTVIHPKARIIADAGPIRIGESNLIEEQVEIINSIPNTILIIGDFNVFEVGARVHSREVGNSNVFESKCFVGPQVRISNGCVIGAMCSLTAPEQLPENTIVFGEGCLRRVATERPMPQTLQLDFLSKILPNYHHLLLLGQLFRLAVSYRFLGFSLDHLHPARQQQMDGQQYQLSGSAVLRKPSAMSASQHQQQQPVMIQQQQQQTQMMSLGQETFAFEPLEGQAIPSALLEQQTRAPEPFTGSSSQARGATMQEVFIQGVVAVSQVELLTARLRGLCREHAVFLDHEEAFSVPLVNAQSTNPVASASGTTPFIYLRARRSVLPNTRELGLWPVLRYLGSVECGDRTCRRSYLEACVNGPLVGFLKCIGFKKDFEFLAEGEVYVRGRAKVLIYAVFEAAYPNSGDMQMSVPSKGRNVAPNSLMVEVSAVGSPADDTLQREVVELMELLHPLVIPGRVDHARLACR
ncbi:Dynactin subunit 6 [Taenia crassiceps]|uniref:Dynactin subunit 6 n=1 Tax=Taenia crassiceps TaxID=6207 RepID=A0ABR4Q971_9CEST